ncbi:MAG: methyltransferase [Planctomycetota bacterium]|jgi:predicted RNA methylase
MPSEDELISMDLVADEDDWKPTPHGILMRDALVARRDLIEGRDVLELGGGVGNHTIVLARQGVRSLVTTEISESRSATTRRNVERNCPGSDNIEYRVADWLSTPGEFDLIVTNPPFMVSGRRNRRHFIDDLILNAWKRLRPDGALMFVQSSMADLAKSQRRLAENGYESGVVAERSGPFRDYYFDDPTFMEEIEGVDNGFEMRDGTHWETLFVLHARLQPWTPPGIAH